LLEKLKLFGTQHTEASETTYADDKNCTMADSRWTDI
jgi:hypothetical protein